MLEALRPAVTGLDDLPAWFLKVGAPFFAAPIADMFNLSLSTSVVPNQWKSASISPLPKIPNHSPQLIIIEFPSPRFCLESWSELSRRT